MFIYLATSYQDQLVDLNQEKLQIWYQDVFLSWRWWFGIASTFIPPIIWTSIRKKSSTARLLLVGIFAVLIATILDGMGIFLGLWNYKYEVVPLIPGYFPWIIINYPIILMVILQIKPKTNAIYKALIYASITAFIGLPILIALDIYEKLNWSLFYSFVIQFILYLVAHSLSKLQTFNSLDS
ncbi:CBO0543 family protein [Metabacillus litoralis]|uniref:CBO0543 family protein n=1 Tax=Metabacillus litoralis TaxID=152268 RepID=UPI00203AD9D4|nr:CBO0543 family protein [Metabacillus litoralis]MCM3410190.1 hypothetical protein [Metabacillus litoralis]